MDPVKSVEGTNMFFFIGVVDYAATHRVIRT